MLASLLWFVGYGVDTVRDYGCDCDVVACVGIWKSSTTGDASRDWSKVWQRVGNELSPAED